MKFFFQYPSLHRNPDANQRHLPINLYLYIEFFMKTDSIMETHFSVDTAKGIRAKELE